MSVRLPFPIATFAVLCSLAGAAPVLAQSSDQTVLAANGAIMQAAVHRPTDGSVDIAGFSRWLLSIASDATPIAIEDAWHARKAAVLGAIGGLAPEKRAEIAAGLDVLSRTMTAYAFDRGHVRQAFADYQETLARYEKEGGLYARSAWEADQDFAERMKKLGLDRNGLVLANDLWTTGGQPLLCAALRVAGELRGALTLSVSDADRAADAAGR
jgi:hypothetical protein